MTDDESQFFLHVLQLHAEYQSGMMRRLANQGHEQLRLSFQPVIRGLAAGGMRPTDLASRLGLQKQNCAQLLNKVEAAGYIERVADRQDRRSRLVRLTAAGEQLVRDGVAVTQAIDGELASVVGEAAFQQLRETLHRLVAALNGADNGGSTPGVGAPGVGAPGVFISDLIELAKFCSSELNRRVRARGYSAIRPAHEQVLVHLGDSGARIKALAQTNDVSRQAISSLVAELQALGYVSLETDPEDARGRVIHLTGEGQKLMRDSTAIAGQLLSEVRQRVGADAFTSLRQALASLHRHLVEGAQMPPQSTTLAATGQYLLTLANATTAELPALTAAELETVAARIRERLGQKDFEQLNGLLGRLAEA